MPEIQRARLLAALVQVTRERGAANVTVAHIIARSGVSRRTFYELFSDRDDCFSAAFGDAVTRAGKHVLAAYQDPARRTGAGGRARGVRGGRLWCERVRAGLWALLEFLEQEPQLGGLCLLDAPGAGPATLKQRANVIEALIDAVDEGRAYAKPGVVSSRVTAEGVVGGVLAVLTARFAAAADGGQVSVVGLLPVLMGMIVLPYLGASATARESARPAPRPRKAPPMSTGNPLQGLDMRLTYRTVRVLVAVGEHPGASNREIANAAGVQDQGQISKLLARLGHLGLVENDNDGRHGQVRGEPNAWRLTAHGSEVQHTISHPAGTLTTG